jgi:hypothetical protein
MADSGACLFAGASDSTVRFMATMPNESGLDPVHPGGGASMGEIAAVTA